MAGTERSGEPSGSAKASPEVSPHEQKMDKLESDLKEARSEIKRLNSEAESGTPERSAALKEEMLRLRGLVDGNFEAEHNRMYGHTGLYRTCDLPPCPDNRKQTRQIKAEKDAE